MPGHCLGVACQTLPVLRYAAKPGDRQGLLSGTLGFSLLRVCAAFLLQLTEPAEPVEMPCLRCNTHVRVWECTLRACLADRQRRGGQPHSRCMQ